MGQTREQLQAAGRAGAAAQRARMTRRERRALARKAGLASAARFAADAEARERRAAAMREALALPEVRRRMSALAQVRGAEKRQHRAQQSPRGDGRMKVIRQVVGIGDGRLAVDLILGGASARQVMGFLRRWRRNDLAIEDTPQPSRRVARSIERAWSAPVPAWCERAGLDALFRDAFARTGCEIAAARACREARG